MNLPILTISGDISKGVDAIDREQHGSGGSMESTAKAKICPNIVQRAYYNISSINNLLTIIKSELKYLKMSQVLLEQMNND